MRIDKVNIKIFALVGLFVYGAILFIQPWEITERILLGRNDFVQLYIGATLSGSPELYSREANQRKQHEIAGLQSDALGNMRLPFYSVLLRPLTWLPYRTAHFTFQAINLAAFLAFLWLFVPKCRELAAFASLSIPFFANLQNGQDATLVLFFAGLSLILFRRGLEFWAGAVLSLCAIKFHLLALVPLMLVMQGRWLVLSGGLAGGAILLILSFAGGGMNWLPAYIAAISNTDVSPHPDYMPNLHTLSAVFNGAVDLGLEIALGLLVVVAVAYLARRLRDYEVAFSFALIGSLLVSIHSYPQDCLILLIPLAILFKWTSSTVRQLMELAVSPIPYFFMLSGVPLNLAMPSLLIAILGVAVASTHPAVATEHAATDSTPGRASESA